MYNKNEIYHFGIKRRSGRYPWGSGERPYQSINRKDIDRASNKFVRSSKFKSDKTIPKGTVVYRVETGNKNDSGYASISYTNRDRDLYRGLYLGDLRSRKGLKGKIENEKDILPEDTYVLTEDLKIPSRQALRDAYASSLSINEVGKAVFDFEFNARITDKASEKEFARELISQRTDKRFTESEAISEYNKYCNEVASKIKSKFIFDSLSDMNLTDSQTFSNYLFYVNHSTELTNKVIDKLKSQGYNAMTDEIGVGGSDVQDRIRGVDPLIVFDRKQSMEYKETNKSSIDEYSKITKEGVDWYAKSRFKERGW